ncbi:uncharacterized protein C8R40DRAFT_1067297 [Lentinula edodes]|uniref:uncharacterized protein n=1 Tax=Lentinula edodes TaxID=5353 RepID=UPI001E8E63F3|nr:uncharacterized protein C8R40DRAFT_1067297 [Lentinula edodes]KAH7878268.1 hypothetical protein C8R40DRAFT_1067297 [Lentinula edodes]
MYQKHWDEPEKTMGDLLGLSEQAGRHWQNVKRDYPNHKEDFTKCKGTFKDFWPTQTGRAVASFIHSHVSVDFTDLDKLDRSLKTKDEQLYEVMEEAFEQSSGAFTPSSQPRSLSLLAARFDGPSGIQNRLALEKCANIPNLGAVDKEAESVDADTETAVLRICLKASTVVSLLLLVGSPSLPIRHHLHWMGASLFSPRESAKSSTSTHSPLRQQTTINKNQAKILTPNPTMDSPSPPPFGSHHKKAPPRPNVSAPSISALPSSSSKQYYNATNLDLSFVVNRNKVQTLFDGVHLPRKKAKLNPSTVAAPSILIRVILERRTIDKAKSKNWKRKDRMLSFSKRNSGWVERYWIVQNSDAEFPGDETDDEDDLPYLDLSEVHKVQASSSYPSVDTGKIAMPLTSPNSKPTTQPHGIPRRALSSVFAGPPNSPNVVAQYADSGSTYESLSTSSASYPSVSVPISFSEPISTQLLNPPGLSEKALGKRKAFDDGVKPHVKRGRPAKPRPSTVLANSSTTRYHGHVSHTHQDAYHAQILYKAREIILSQIVLGNMNCFCTSTQTNAHIPGLTSPPPIAVVGNPFLGDGAESGNDPQQAKDDIEMLQLQRPGQTIATGNTLPQPQSNGSLNGFLNMPRRDVGIGHEITNRNSSVHGDHRGVDVGEWLIPSLGIPEAGDQLNSGMEPGLYSGLSRSSRAGIEISTPDHPAIQFGQQKHTSMPPDPDILDSSERVYYSSDPLPHRGKQRMISVQLKARTRRNTDPQSSATSPVPQPPPPVLQSNASSLVLDYGSNSD